MTGMTRGRGVEVEGEGLREEVVTSLPVVT